MTDEEHNRESAGTPEPIVPPAPGAASAAANPPVMQPAPPVAGSQVAPPAPQAQPATPTPQPASQPQPQPESDLGAQISAAAAKTTAVPAAVQPISRLTGGMKFAWLLIGCFLSIPGMLLAWVVNVDKPLAVRESAILFAVIGFVISFGLVMVLTLSGASYVSSRLWYMA